MKQKTKKQTYTGAEPASRHPILSNFLRYYLTACILVGACFWFVPTQPLVPEDADVAKVAIHHIQMKAEASGIVAQTEQDAESYEYTADDEEFSRILSLLEERSCRRTFRGLFGANKLDGKGGLNYYQQIVLYDKDGSLLSYMTCDGSGKLLKYRVHRMNKAGQRQMMEDLRQIYEG